MSDRLDLRGLLLDIRSQATRKDRASDLKRYLLTDLEVIAERAERALALLPDTKDLPADAQLVYADEVTIVHDRLQSPDAGIRDVIEFLIGIGSVPSVTGCKHETTITFEIPCSTTWEACERAHEVDVFVGAYGVHPTFTEDKIVTRPWANTCAEAMRRLER